MDVQEIQRLIQAAMPDAQVRVEDPMNDRTHFQAVVVSPSFRGKSRVQQHQMVYRALGGAFDGPLHALQLKTMTPEQT